MLDLATRLDKLSPRKRALLNRALQQGGAAFSSFPLSYAQQRIWFLDQLDPGTPAYTISGAFRLVGRLDVAALSRAVNQIVRRHAALRTTFPAVDGQPFQSIAAALTVEAPLLDLSSLAEADREPEASRLAAAEAQRRWDLAHGPLLRATVLRLGAEQHILLANIHHIVFDLWSLEIFARELLDLYARFTGEGPAERAAPLPQPRLHYHDFTRRQRDEMAGEARRTQLAYWKGRLYGAPGLLELPTDRVRPAVQSLRGASRQLAISRSLADSLEELGRGEGATLFMTLLAAYNVLLYRYSGQDDLLVGTPIANRGRAEFQQVIGLFLNTLVLRSDLSGTPSFREVLGRVRDVALQAYEHQDLPFEMLVDALQPERDLSRNPLFQALFILQPARSLTLELPNLRVSRVPLEMAWSHADLALWLTDGSDGLTGTLTYSADLFEDATIARMATHLEELLAAITAEPDRPVSELPLLSDAEQRLLASWNDTQRPVARAGSFVELFEAQVRSTPDAVAVVCEDQQLSYRQLDRRANRLARRLVEHNVEREVVVALLLERGIEYLIAVLAVFKAGGAYLPLDPQHPAARHGQVLEQSKAPLVLASSAFLPALEQALDAIPAAARPRVVSLEETPHPPTPSPTKTNWDLASQLPVWERRGEDAAYVIFTSGSTGTPKGAVVEQRGMLNHLHAKIADLDLTAGDTVAQTASQCFDISVWQFLAPLLVGGCVQVYRDEVAHDPPRLLAAIAHDRVTILETVPSLLRAMLETQPANSNGLPDLPALRWLIPTGEALTPELCRLWLQFYPTIPLMNAYGPTECSDDVTHHPIAAPPPAHAIRVPIGRPIANLRIHVLDARLEPAPIGVAGELYVGGAGVGRGYLNDAGRTAESFVPDPFGDTPGGRMYRTGDLGRYLPDGTIEFLGRVDQQVKIRGFRIEAGEIEMVLRRHPGVTHALVLAREDTPGDPRLVAYLVADPQPDTAELAGFLKQRLPAYMVPAAFVLLEALPLTPNGKVDRRALPAPAYSRAGRADVPRTPRDEVERRLVAIWQRVLDVQPIGVDDDFFELGGHSILAVRLMAQIEQAFGRRLPLATLFERTTIEQLAQLLRNSTERHWSSLVPVQPNGAKRPFFCVHPGGGHVMAYHRLAQLLGTDRPFYGLQAIGIDGQAEPLADFELMAARYIAELRQVQPVGPYLLGGWCTGGRIAHEMACRLEAQGERVALLVFFDATPDAEGMPGPDILPDDSALLASMSPAFHYGAELRRLPPEQRLPRLVAQLQQAGAVPPDVELEQIRNILSVYRAIVRAELKYVPRHYGGRITLFRAERRPPDRGPDLGWRRSAAAVDVIDVPGDHLSMIEDPSNLAVLAERLRGNLESAA